MNFNAEKPTTESAEVNANTIGSCDGASPSVESLILERDQLRTQNAALLADCVVMRGVMGSVQERILASDDFSSDEIIEMLRSLATNHPGAPLIEAARKAVEVLRSPDEELRTKSENQALAELEKFLP